MKKPNWSEAPDDAQFYSEQHFRKHEMGCEFNWHGGKWGETRFDTFEWHKNRDDFEIRPLVSSFSELPVSPSWIPWNTLTKKCPVPHRHDVEVRFLDGSTGRNCNPAHWIWDSESTWQPIIYYRDWTAFYASRPAEPKVNTQETLIEWSGKGLPPVGWVGLADKYGTWVEGKVVYHGSKGNALFVNKHDIVAFWADQFKPIPTPQSECKAWVNQVQLYISKIPVGEDYPDSPLEIIFHGLKDGTIPTPSNKKD